MRIPLIYIPKTKYKKFLYIEKKYRSNKEIIPIGCDCHPAYTLQKLNIRKHSLPFDWLNTDSIKGLKFLSENIESNFNYFLADLYKNERGNIVSEKYSFAEFMHEKHLIENKADKEKFIRRIDRFKKLLKGDIYFLYNIASISLSDTQSVSEFYNSVLKLKTLLKKGQLLFIYLRYDESLNENKNNCEKLVKLVNQLDNIKIVNYIREKEKEGIWGNEKNYTILYKSLGIKIYQVFPKVYIK